MGGEEERRKRNQVPKRFHGIIVASNAVDGISSRIEGIFPQ